MTEPINVVRFRQPDDVDDPLTEVLRAGARRLLAQAVELEAEAFLAARDDLRLPDGRPRLVRHGHGPERQVQTGIGPVPVSRAKIRGLKARLDYLDAGDTLVVWKRDRLGRSLPHLLTIVTDLKAP